MARLVGFTNNDDPQSLYNMRELLIHRDFYVKDDIFCDSNVCASRVHKNILQRYKQPVIENQVCIWIEGEFYNLKGSTNHAEVIARYFTLEVWLQQVFEGRYRKEH